MTPEWFLKKAREDKESPFIAKPQGDTDSVSLSIKRGLRNKKTKAQILQEEMQKKLKNTPKELRPLLASFFEKQISSIIEQQHTALREGVAVSREPQPIQKPTVEQLEAEQQTSRGIIARVDAQRKAAALEIEASRKANLADVEDKLRTEIDPKKRQKLVRLRNWYSKGPGWDQAKQNKLDEQIARSKNPAETKRLLAQRDSMTRGGYTQYRKLLGAGGAKAGADATNLVRQALGVSKHPPTTEAYTNIKDKVVAEQKANQPKKRVIVTEKPQPKAATTIKQKAPTAAMTTPQAPISYPKHISHVAEQTKIPASEIARFHRGMYSTLNDNQYQSRWHSRGAMVDEPFIREYGRPSKGLHIQNWLDTNPATPTVTQEAGTTPQSALSRQNK